MAMIGGIARQAMQKLSASAPAHAWLRLASRNELAARVHTLAFTNALGLEARAVVAGQLGHVSNRANAERVNYFLRRSIHRLEKGLLMLNRREIFATGYIEQTVDVFAQAAACNHEPEELGWAHAVLAEFFAHAGGHPAIDRARIKFQLLNFAPVAVDEPVVPYLVNRLEPSPVDPEAMALLAKRRRSVRFFEDRPVPREKLDAALQVARQSPSACNRQPLQFRIFDTPERACEIASLAGGTSGFAEQIPCLVAIVGRLRAYPYARDRHVIYVDGGLAAMALMFALETHGLSSCPINWPDVRERELQMAKTINLLSDERVVMLMAVGYARGDAKIAASRKVALEELRSYEER